MSAPGRVALFDAHNHLQDAWLTPHRADVFRTLAALPIHGAVVNGTAETDWPDVAALCAPAFPLRPPHLCLRASFGLHPWHVGNATSAWRDSLRRHLEADPLAAVGEIGLDRWILERAKPDDPRLAGLPRAPLDAQIEACAWQLAEAAARGRAATLHCLDAWGPLAQLLRSSPLPSRGFLLHAYGGSPELARELLPLGAYFSFHGAFLAARHAAKRAVFAALPADRLLVETDAPAMALPVTHRTHALPDLPDGSVVNHPANLVATYTGLAALRGSTVPALAAQVAANAARLFGPFAVR
jgi:TatD DNase family protein